MPPSTRYLLTYDYVPNVLEKRGPHREGHLGLARTMIECGTCVSGGPTSIPGGDGVPKGGEFASEGCMNNGGGGGGGGGEWTGVSPLDGLMLFVYARFDYYLHPSVDHAGRLSPP